MEKKIKYIFCLIIILFAWIAIDRTMNINPFIVEDKTGIITISDSIWTNVPKGKLIQLDDKFKPLQSFVYTKNYHPTLRTYTDYHKIETHYQFKIDYEPRMLTIIESENDFNSSIDLPTKTTIDQMDVSYGILDKPDHISDEVTNIMYAIQIKTDRFIIIIRFNKSDLNDLKPTLHEIFKQLQ